MNRLVYLWFLRLMLPVVLVRLAWRGLRNPDYWQRIPERFGFIEPVTKQRVIWIHAVSVGEVRASAPLVRELSEHYPYHSLLITTMTPTGSAQVRALFVDKVAHCYAPYDYPSAIRRFLDRTKPVMTIVMETELWPNIFHLCRERGIPVFVTNVRMSDFSMRKYQRFASLARATLLQVSRFAAQSPADANRLMNLGAAPETVTVTGSIKFELNIGASMREAAEVLRLTWGQDRPVWLAASTHEGEEETVLMALAALKTQPRFANMLLVLVPRHPERFTAVARLCKKNFRIALRSETPGAIDPATEVLVGDTMGELQLFYGAADVAFIGGSLVPTGGHNLLEASALGKPVVFGPHMFNFQEISQMTLDRGAGVQVQSLDQLSAAVSDFLGNANRRDSVGEAGRKMVEENRGALTANMRLIEQLIK
ncbi:MAG: lipid IV(A) 3-deoxy-D-manno-octulosonic acid transferase [Sulfuricaulis sp.]|uniref:lipid IV(A) 3-deoxy-D-manno-octulosonic acid transferase n=1 Tax=Sulfuricaulis sp. TaxID=2003553 RepID=UPI0025E46CCD|nr:lipid IV(A) 3-deoxy-D-manno-octulosonic acid transferase [Sulfuricaulis sp.]MCR4347738.1 lipid IV(A) 3-deoxy-D-manno-octulosonic acid transferase [Sulfuricaulis sp.]